MRNIPAFPQDLAGRRSDDPGLQGMTLRDYFAAKAMQGLLAQSIGSAMSSNCSLVAEYAYKMADAMLTAREARHEGTNQ